MKLFKNNGYSAIEITISLLIISISALSFGTFADLLAKVDSSVNRNMRVTDLI